MLSVKGSSTYLTNDVNTIILRTIRRIIDTVRLQILYDSGMELDLLRHPLRDMEIAFDELDLDQDLKSVDEDKTLKGWLKHEDDDTYATICERFYLKIQDQMIAVHSPVRSCTTLG